MSKIKDEKKARELFGFGGSFGTYNLEQVAEDKNNLTADELTETIEDEETRQALKELKQRKTEAQKAGRGRPRNPNSQEEKRATFVVNKEQYSKIREICYRERLFEKEVVYEVFERYIKEYEEKRGCKVSPRGKSKL